MIKKLVAGLMIANLWLVGCDSSFEDNTLILGPYLTASAMDQQRSMLIDRENYVISGSMTLDLLPQGRYGSNTNTRGSASFVYKRNGLSYVFVVTHAVAGRLLKINRTERGLELTNSDGVVYNFPSEEAFLKAVKIPAGRLPYWIMGIALGDESKVQYDEYRRLKYANAMNWHVNYYEYGAYNNFILPKRLKLDNSTVGTIKVTVDNWEFN